MTKPTGSHEGAQIRARIMSRLWMAPDRFKHRELADIFGYTEKAVSPIIRRLRQRERREMGKPK